MLDAEMVYFLWRKWTSINSYIYDDRMPLKMNARYMLLKIWLCFWKAINKTETNISNSFQFFKLYCYLV